MMRFVFNASNAVTQTKLVEPTGDGYTTGNCTEAALATLLQIPIEDVPEFDRTDAFTFWDGVEEFLKTRGLYIHYLGRPPKGEGCYLASGPTERGVNTHHTVVYENNALVWDPHPSRAGLTEVVWYLEINDKPDPPLRSN